jgi:tetratricopeptide (TPR) repeat protein
MPPMQDAAGERPARPAARDGRFTFAHLLTRDAAYWALLASNRAALHRRAAEVLTARLVNGSPEEVPLLGRIVGHLEAAGDYARAHAQGCTLLLRRAALGRLQQWEAALAELERLWELARRADPALPATPAIALNVRASCLTHTNHMPEAREAAQAALALARQEQSPLQIAMALNGCGIVAHYSGLHSEAFHYYDAARQAFEDLGDRQGVAQLCNNLGVARIEIDDAAGARTILEQGLALAEELGSMQLQANLALNVGLALAELGLPAARTRLMEAVRLSRELGNLGNESLSLGYLGELEERAGHPATARDYYTAAVRLSRVTGSTRFTAWWLDHLCALELRAGRLDAARELALDACAQAHLSGGRTVEAYALAELAEVEQSAGALESAEALRQRAAALLPAGGGRLWRLTAKLEALRDKLAPEQTAEAPLLAGAVQVPEVAS